MSCHENVIIHMALVVIKLTPPYDKHRALDAPSGMRVQCNPTGVKSINEFRPRKFCCFAKYFAEREDFLLGHCFPAGQRWNGTWVVPTEACVWLACMLEEVQLHTQTTHEGRALMKQSILRGRLFVLFRLAENLSAQFQSQDTLASNVDWIVAPQGSVCQENWGVTHVVAFRVRGGKDPEMKNDLKAQRLNSMGGQVSPTHDSGKCPCSPSGWWSRAVGGGEMHPSPKAETALPRRGEWHTSDAPWTMISRGYGCFQAEPDHWKLNWWQPMEVGTGNFCWISS